MRHFATQSGKSKGQFYTPAEVSRIMAQVIGIEPGHQAGPNGARSDLRFRVTPHQGRDEAPNGLTIYGQEKDVATWTMARMNLILHGREAAVIERDNTLTNPHFTDVSGHLKRFDFAVANPRSPTRPGLTASTRPTTNTIASSTASLRPGTGTTPICSTSSRPSGAPARVPT